jgi:hypothetical protein
LFAPKPEADHGICEQSRATDLLRASCAVISNRSEPIIFGDTTMQTYQWNPWSIFDDLENKQAA